MFKYNEAIEPKTPRHLILRGMVYSGSTKLFGELA